MKTMQRLRFATAPRCLAVVTILTVFLLLVLCPPHSAFAEIEKIKKKYKVKHKTDLVVMENADRNTGEIKKLEFGVLYLKSDRAADTLELDWERVVRVQSTARYEFEMKTRETYYGTIAADTGGEVPPGELKILLDDGSQVQLKIVDIISIYEMGRSILSRINLSLDAGGSLTSANSRIQYNIDLSTSFRKPKYSVSLALSSQFGREPGTADTSRQELEITANRYLTKKWDALLLTSFLKDNQQELELRTIVGGGVQRHFYESQRTLVFSIGGVVFTNEKYFDTESNRNNAEALAALGLSTYRFRGSTLNTVVSVFPSLSDAGRIRVDADFDWYWKIVGDLYWKISLTDNYDNRPPPGGINNNLTITTGFGWSF